MTSYQDVRLNGRTIDHGERDCATRYALIRQALPLYARPITLLDLGAAQGYFGLRFAEDLPCVAVMIDRDPSLHTMLVANDLPMTIGLQHALTEGDLEALADCEHLDVVLALNVLHHFPEPSRALRAVLRMGEDIFLEVPGPEDTGACGDSHPWLEGLIVEAGGTVIGETPSHTTPGAMRRLYHVRRTKAGLTRAYMGGHPPELRPHQIVSRPEVKFWQMPDKEEGRTWFPGINLQTALTLGLVYPSRAEVAALVESETRRALFGTTDVGFAGVSHHDIRVWNYVLSGRMVTLIDWRDSRQAEEDDTVALANVVKEIRG